MVAQLGTPVCEYDGTPGTKVIYGVKKSQRKSKMSENHNQNNKYLHDKPKREECV